MMIFLESFLEILLFVRCCHTTKSDLTKNKRCKSLWQKSAAPMKSISAQGDTQCNKEWVANFMQVFESVKHNWKQSLQVFLGWDAGLTMPTSSLKQSKRWEASPYHKWVIFQRVFSPLPPLPVFFMNSLTIKVIAKRYCSRQVNTHKIKLERNV